MASEAERLSQVLASLVDAPAPMAATTAMVGLEHEYRVLAGSTQVDFRPLIGRLRLGRPNLDPGDPNAFRLRSGSVITCDGAEAEIALPPTPRNRGFAAEMTTRAAGEEAALARLMPPGYRLEGCSTHISVAVADSQTREVAALYARTFAPAMMLMLDGPDSPGLLVRPRPGRVELCGEFIAGPRLSAALNFAVGSLMACLFATGRGAVPAIVLPPVLDFEPEPARERYGWYVDREAFGADLYVVGRRTPLSLRGGGTTTAQRQLELSWAAARTALHPLLSAADAAQIEAMVGGRLPLPIEAPATPASVVGSALMPDPAAEAILAPMHRSQFDLAPVMVTWDIVVQLVVGHGGRGAAFLSLPSRTWPTFLGALREGRLDDVLCSYLALGSTRRRLDRRSQALQVGLYDALGPRRFLLAPEPVSHQRSRPAGARAVLGRLTARLSGPSHLAPAPTALVHRPGA